MSEDCLSRIKVFNGENFSLWKFQFRLLMEQQKLLELLEGLEIKPNVVSSDSNSESSLQNWKSKDVKARMLLSQAIELRFLQPLMNCTSASQMWQKLLAIHEQKSEFTIGLLWQQFFDARLTSETINDYIAKIENISAQISQMGGTITEDQKVAKILNTLPSSMRYFVAAWESLDPKAQTLKNLTARLLIEETRNQQSGSSKQDEALLHRQARTLPKDTQRSFQDAKKNTKCHYCHKIGHWSRECRKRLANEKNKSKNLHDSKGSSSDYGLILCDNQVEPNDIWYADSGASCSMTFRREWFKTYTPFTSDHPIYLGDNSTLLAEGMGDIEIQAYVDGGWYNTYIRNVLYSPQLKKNLYSLSTSTRRGFNVIIKHDKLQIFMDNDLKAVGVRHDDLYRMLFKVTSSSQGYITSENKLQLWHERLAHLPVATLREMATKGLVDGLQPQDLEGEFFFCEGCQLGKAHRKSCYPSDGKNYQLGEFIYADICGPMQTQSLSKYLYFCLFKDYFSGYRHIYFIKNKSDVLDIFKEYATLIYTQTGNKIKVLRTDNALEFKSDNFADLCKRFGIIHEFTAPYVHEQIGRIERDNRTIVEAARSMLNLRNLPGFFWAEAYNTATYILNRSATKQTPGTTPYELFFGTKPNVANYKIFGCNAYMHIPKENRKKWDNKSIKLMFLGYENTSKNFRLWDWKTRKIRISKDVTFDEIATPHSDRESTKPKEIIFQINSAPDESPVATPNIPVQEMPPVSDISSHPMITRSKVSNSKCNFALLADEPSSYVDAMASSDSERWKLAMDEEIDALNKNKTWTLERLADGHKPIGCKWVYKIKTESDGTIQRFKARLVAKGYSQIKNVDYFDTFSPVVRYDSLRILLSHAASERMFLKQFDVKTAFLNGELEELVYLEQPEGYKRDDNSCYRLHKSLYGLKQSSRNWNKKFTNFLYSHNFKTSDADPCIFIGTHNDSNVILALYVDDGIILSKDKEAIAIIMDELEHAFEITSGSVNFFVGLQIEQSEDRASIFIHQSSYIDKILSKFNMADCIPASVPMDPSVILTKQDCPTPEQKEKMPKFPFREAVGSLMFASCVSRPDITYAVSQVSKFLEYPGPAHCTTVKNIFRYLKGTPHMGILFTGQDQLDVRYHFIRSKHEEGELKVHHVCSSEQLADIMTKPLPRNKFHYLRGLLNILDREGVKLRKTQLSTDKLNAMILRGDQLKKANEATKITYAMVKSSSEKLLQDSTRLKMLDLQLLAKEKDVYATLSDKNKVGGADTPRKSYKQRLVDGTTSKKIPRAESRGRKDVEENPTSRVSWTGKDALEYPSSSNLRTEKDVLDNQRVVTIRQPTRDNWTSHKTRKACDGAATPERRKAIRGTFTRIINEINGEFEKSQIDRNDIYSKFNRLESYYTKLVGLNEKYQALLVVKEGITEESIDREWQECDKYEEEKFDIQQKVSVLRNPDKKETIPIASEDTVINVKLPELALKSYDGSLEGWLPWWAQFSKIHENKNLSDSDRFLYLRQAIVPNSEAYRVVASYPVTGANYVLAVQALQERFGDPNILTELYVRRLLNSVISNVKIENRNLSSLYDELSSHLRSLETLGIDPQLSGIFLYPLVESSLPSDILKIWHRHPSSGYGMELAKREESDKGVGGAQERLRLLLDFLKAEVRSAQRLKFVEKGFKQEEPYKRSYNDGTRTRSNFRPATVSSLFGGRTNIKCFFCERTNHASHQCRSIMKMSPGERNDKIRSAHLCFKCLRKGHIQSQCREQLECKNCGRNHLEVLCEGNSSNRLMKPGKENLKENAPEPIASLSSQACTGQVLLMTTVALLRGPNASRRVRILLDSGSQFSYIKQSLVWGIGIERKGEITIAKSLFGGNKIGEEKHGKFMLELENLGNKRDVIHIEALDQRKICDAIPPLPKGDWLEKLKIKGIILSQDNFKGQEIDILIGANYLGMILTGKIVQVEADLTAVETKLGWTLMGNSPIIDSNDNVQQTLNLLTTRCDLKDLWDLEVLGIRDPVETCSKETRYQEIKEKFITKIQRQSDQRYSVGLPWKVEKESIPSNLDIAIKRLDISTKKMNSQNKLTEYSQIFSDWLTEGLIERVEENPLERRGYYLPHRPVYKMESKTTPIRPVFDASCLGHNGLSLNQCLEKGPNLLERIPEIMIRFRENKFGVTADIRKAFQMVAIEESERNYLRFLWWEEESDRELIAYRHKRLVFGLNCSPFVLNAVIEYHLQSIRGTLVQWAKILAQSFYMDNCITSLETKQEVQEFQKAAIEIMDRAKMDLREWEYSLEENPEKGTCTKILGVVWNKMEDSLKCELPDILSLQPKLTKRLVLSMVQRIFDPLGFCAPVFLPPKLLLQRSWGLKLGWDTPLPESMAQEFRTWLDQIKLIELIKIPRYMWNDLIFPTEVHIFCDASQIGYGAVAYLRSETGRENTLTLIWSKVRLAPMKSITIPRLELMAMVLGARLANAIQAALKRKCETTLWSDSTTALSWIKKEIEWRVFVRNRVREIQATTNLNDWRFVPSQLNPADLLSRGCPPSQFVQSRWWEGPEWLKKPKEFWPNSEFSINPKEIKVEENIMKTNNDLKPLTPNEFLQNGPESSFPEFENLKPEMLHTRYRELGQLKRELKQRFLKEYLGALIQKSENIDRRQLKVGDVVLIGQENLKRMFWPKGRIVNLIPGKDGIVRVAHVKTSTGTLIRALQRLHPLEISSNVETIQKDNSKTEPQSDAFLGNRPNIESRDSRNRYGGADTPRKSYKQRLVDGTTSKKIPRAESRGRKDVEENPTSRVSWTGKDALEYPSSSNLRTEKDVLDNQRVVTIRQPTRDNWTSHKTRKACDGAATPELEKQMEQQLKSFASKLSDFARTNINFREYVRLLNVDGTTLVPVGLTPCNLVTTSSNMV
ncbi:hypothetical protein LAZ67_10002447 [Cordylochernes scorpioides]|uniref:Gag-Pol-p199 n=1 Tax=Cordylochernes scorpioides TaxID=51811 RepID=A0ABY6KWP2_9ARAC|nr:hypothetical protein LAZ67_10002447 [Cordylochernes scorpioides]